MSSPMRLSSTADIVVLFSESLQDYAPNFRKNGYEKAKFIAGMTDQVSS